VCQDNLTFCAMECSQMSTYWAMVPSHCTPSRHSCLVVNLRDSVPRARWRKVYYDRSRESQICPWLGSKSLTTPHFRGCRAEVDSLTESIIKAHPNILSDAIKSTSLIILLFGLLFGHSPLFLAVNGLIPLLSLIFGFLIRVEHLSQI
jgi:hypothetical protein